MFSEVLPGDMSGFGDEDVAIDAHEKYCQPRLSVPGAADMTAADYSQS